METRLFTVEEMLQAAEQAKLPNYNGTYIDYRYGDSTTPIQACVIGEAFINLGFVENGVDASSLSFALTNIPIDTPIFKDTVRLKVNYGSWHEEIPPSMVSDLSGFINVLNSYRGYSGKKRIANLVRKHFANHLDTVIAYSEEEGFQVLS